VTDTESFLPPTGVDDLSGTMLGARFRLLRQLGRGGMGAVYLAEDTAGVADGAGAFPRVAVKVIKGGLVDDPAAIKRFEREAITIGRLNHPHIVGYRGTGEVAGVHWLAMEFLDGQSLRERIATAGPLPWRLSLDVIGQITDGLAAAHAAGVLHRDLKPDNVMLVGDNDKPTVKLLDFGIAKQTGGEAMTMTGTGLIVGTPGFIAPEVIVGAVTDDPRSDLYALGVMWFEMVTGARPFDANTPFALAMKHVQEAAPRPNTIRPFSPIPSPVEDTIVRLLEKSPERRHQSAKVLAATIARLVEIADNPPEPASSQLRTTHDLRESDATETGFSPFPSSSGTLPPAPLAPPPPPAAVVAPAPASTSRMPVLVAGLAIIAILIVAIVVVTSRTPSTTPTPPPVITATPPTPPPTSTPPPPPVTAPPPATPPPVTAPTPPPPPPKTPTKKPGTHTPHLLLD
jgi:eukaryotic-like serine/threonine-protein kinase